jgi:hypothetical protein
VKAQDFAAGSSTFTATADDEVRVCLDAAVAIDQWKDQPTTTTYTASRQVTAGDTSSRWSTTRTAVAAVAKLAISP